MIDQKIIIVDNRGITTELAMRLLGQDYTREMAQIGRFFDENAAEVNYLITQHYLAELSRGRSVTSQRINQLVHTVVTRDLCRYFPSMTGPQIESAKALFLVALHEGFHSRVNEITGVWDTCEVKELSLDTYAVICTRQVSQPVPASGASRIFQYPINFPRPTAVSM